MLDTGPWYPEREERLPIPKPVISWNMVATGIICVLFLWTLLLFSVIQTYLFIWQPDTRWRYEPLRQTQSFNAAPYGRRLCVVCYSPSGTAHLFFI